MAESTAPTADPRRGALAGWALDAAGGAGVSLAVTGFRTLVNIRGRADDPAFVAAATQALQVGLPPAPNRWSGDDARAVLWLGPDEWLLIAPDGEADAVERQLRAAAGADPWVSVVDLSHSYTGMVLSGPRARDVLAKGCPLDLHPGVFAAGECAQSVLAGTRVVLRAAARFGHIELWVRNSFARYTARWLMDAMAEFRG